MDVPAHALNNAVEVEEETPVERISVDQSSVVLGVTTNAPLTAEETCQTIKEETHAFNNLQRTTSGSRLMRHVRSLSGNEVAQSDHFVGSRHLEKLRSELHESRRALEVSQEEAHLAARIGQTLLHRNQQMDRELESRSIELHERAAMAERQIARLEQKLQDAAARLRALDLRNAELVHEKEALSQETQTLRQSNALVKKDIEKLKGFAESHVLSAIETAKLQTELDEIRQTKDRLLAEKTQLRERTHELEQAEATHLKTIERLETELRLSAHEKLQLKKQVHTLQQAQATLQQDHMSQAIQLQNTTSRLEFFEETKQLMTREIFELRELLRAETQKSRALERRRDELEAILLVLDLKNAEKGSLGSFRTRSFSMVELTPHMQDQLRLQTHFQSRKLSEELPRHGIREFPDGNADDHMTASSCVQTCEGFPSSFLMRRIGSDGDTSEEEDLKRIDQLSGHELLEALDLPLLGGVTVNANSKEIATTHPQDGIEAIVTKATSSEINLRSSLHVSTISASTDDNQLKVVDRPPVKEASLTMKQSVSELDVSTEELQRIDQLSSQALLDALDLPFTQPLSAKAMKVRIQRRRRSVSLKLSKESQLRYGSNAQEFDVEHFAEKHSAGQEDTSKDSVLLVNQTQTTPSGEDMVSHWTPTEEQRKPRGSQKPSQRSLVVLQREISWQKEAVCRFCSCRLHDSHRVHSTAVSPLTAIEIDPLEEFFLLTAAAVKANGFGLDNDRCNIPNEALLAEAMEKGLAYDRFHSWLCWRLSGNDPGHKPVGGQRSG